MIEYRPVTTDDQSLLENMYRKEIEDHSERAKRFAKDLVHRFNTIIAISEDEVCGTVAWEPRGGLDDGVVEMTGLGVIESHKRRGIASKLVNAMLVDAAHFFAMEGYDLRVVILFMEKMNEIARRFYSANKFKEVAVIPSLYPDDDAAIWTRHL
ncbi:MAG: GNAT family N-acetyltransferase [Candidatus Thorarchaeota archaeon]